MALCSHGSLPPSSCVRELYSRRQRQQQIVSTVCGLGTCGSKDELSSESAVRGRTFLVRCGAHGFYDIGLLHSGQRAVPERKGREGLSWRQDAGVGWPRRSAGGLGAGQNRRGCSWRQFQFQVARAVMGEQAYTAIGGSKWGHMQMHSDLPFSLRIKSKNKFDSMQNRGSFVRAAVGPDIAVGAGVVVKVIDDLGVDALTFLITTVVVVPAAKFLKVSPILGFLGAGVVLNQLGLIRNITDIATVSELGILFLLFQMGLELSIDRLQGLAKFAFGLGLSQLLLCTALFSFFGLPSQYPISPAALLEALSHFISTLPEPIAAAILSLPPFPSHLFAPLLGLTLDEDVIIAMALSLSSSAFVLKLLGEQNESDTRHGSATLGVLLMQDIAVVPLLAVLPLLEGGFSSAASASLPPAGTAAGGGIESLLSNLLGPSGMALGGEGGAIVLQTLFLGALKGLLGLGLILLGGEFVMKRVFRVVESSESPEAFLALSLLVVTGTALLTERLGLSDSLGAFLAGTILSSSNHKEAVQQYTGPLERLLLGLFFLTTGTSIDISLLQQDYPSIFAILACLLASKTAVIALLGPRFGLSLSEGMRTAFLLSQGGEFAFVVLALANELGVLPMEVNRILIIVVVLSMALTPALNEMGKVVANLVEFVAPPENGIEPSVAAAFPTPSSFSSSEAEMAVNGEDGNGAAVVNTTLGHEGEEKVGSCEEPVLSEAFHVTGLVIEETAREASQITTPKRDL